MKNIKLNLGASPIWFKEGWYILDHKIKKTNKTTIAGDAINIDLPDESCSVIFCSHVFEHIPHYRLPIILSEINRVLEPGGVFRILTPDLELLCRKYTEKDTDFFEKARLEDENIRTDLGFGGMLMNFIVSPGQDTILIDRNVSEFIGGYAHVYAYDFKMLEIILKKLGYTNIIRSEFEGSSIKEMKEPLHVTHLEPVWVNLNKEFYEKNNLIHRFINNKYEINFKLTGFDRDPLTSLIIECKKDRYINKNEADLFFNKSFQNYNRYGKSLLYCSEVVSKLDKYKINYEL
jgi:SAM-dependent methyltransferase